MSLRDTPGAHVRSDGSTSFRVWAPDPRDLLLIVEPARGPSISVRPARDEQGYYSTVVPGVGAGDRYRYRLDGVEAPDPASRFQPDGVFGASAIVDPASFAWTDAAWPGTTLTGSLPGGHVIYELHLGTFTPEGTWRAAAERLPGLQRLGISMIEVMPVAAFPGRFGWGYDGVFPFAPQHVYGTPHDARAFVNQAHALGLAVILDVVYNHFGPAGCVHRRYAAAYFSRNVNEWGDSLNFDGPGAGPVREYFCANAAHWIREYHFDGLRLDATQSIHDRSGRHVVSEITAAARAAAGGRSIVITAENERQETRVMRPVEEGGHGVDAMWNDDFHHSAVVAMTGRRDAYYSDHHGTPQELISAARHGFLFQGQRYAWQKAPRGHRADGIVPAKFVTFVENHDQVANSGDGSRLWQRTSPGRYRAMTALLLLLPATPMLFQGQEFGSSKPFLYFADHDGDLAAAVQTGRAEFMRQFRGVATPGMQARLPVPHDPATFARCVLDWCEAERHTGHRRLHRDLIALRRRTAAFSAQTAVDGAVLGHEAFALRFPAGEPREERLLIVNLGADLDAGSFAEPLVAPPDGLAWLTAWSSEDPEYGGLGSSPIVGADGWHVPGHSATVLAAEADDAGA